MPHPLLLPLKDALRTAMQEAIASGARPEVDLEMLHASLSALLQTTTRAAVPAVADLRHRAMIAAQLDEIFSELGLAQHR